MCKADLTHIKINLNANEQEQRLSESGITYYFCILPEYMKKNSH